MQTRHDAWRGTADLDTQIAEDYIMSANYLEDLFGLDGQTAVVIGGAGVLGRRAVPRPGPGRRPRRRRRPDRGGLPGPRRAHSRSSAARPATARSTSPSASRSRTCWPPRSKQTGRADILVNCAGVNAGTHVPRRHRRRLGPHPDDQPQGRVPGLPGLRPAHGRRRAAGRSSTSAASPRTCRCRGCSPTRPRRPAC